MRELISISPELAKKLREHTIAKHGKLHGCMKIEAEYAIEDYLRVQKVE